MCTLSTRRACFTRSEQPPKDTAMTTRPLSRTDGAGSEQRRKAQALAWLQSQGGLDRGSPLRDAQGALNLTTTLQVTPDVVEPESLIRGRSGLCPALITARTAAWAGMTHRPSRAGSRKWQTWESCGDGSFEPRTNSKRDTRIVLRDHKPRIFQGGAVHARTHRRVERCTRNELPAVGLVGARPGACPAETVAAFAECSSERVDE